MAMNLHLEPYHNMMAQPQVHHLLLVTFQVKEELSTREVVNFQRIPFDEFPVLDEDIVRCMMRKILQLARIFATTEC